MCMLLNESVQEQKFTCLLAVIFCVLLLTLCHKDTKKGEEMLQKDTKKWEETV